MIDNWRLFQICYLGNKVCWFVIVLFLSAMCMYLPVKELDTKPAVPLQLHHSAQKPSSIKETLSSQDGFNGHQRRNQTKCAKSSFNWCSFLANSTLVELCRTNAPQSVASIASIKSPVKSQVIKRGIGGKFCPVDLILDNSFLEKHGNNKARAIKAAIALFDSANENFLSTTFSIRNVHYHGYGNALFEIHFDNDRLFAHNAHSNWSKEDLESRLLDQKRAHYPTDTCLTYLITNKAIVDQYSTVYNGFCYEQTICDHRRDGRNVGVVSVYSCKEANNTACVRTLTHELGHSWGAQHETHDPSLLEGDYLMSETLVSPGTNNLLVIAFIIEQIAFKCFDKSASRCGNLRVEGNEQCDSGGPSVCCTDKCQFTPGAECSSLNEELCTEQCTRPKQTAAQTDGTFNKFFFFITEHYVYSIAVVLMFFLAVVAIYRTINWRKRENYQSNGNPPSPVVVPKVEPKPKKALHLHIGRGSEYNASFMASQDLVSLEMPRSP